ncbi:transcriptional regulator [Roseivivax halodurans JCM 10272]|uniref:Transcriptional regulator n=1 Tax=Roseivivax halodurans JCM 10272 TaxID=1449350 RepID=X7EKB2_9RHOB|nr:response regulator transcription factor [Roseivivax halodurans]ETX16315.1 transcriptional regulator [Roseivivax halodurans JCM 10272]
MNLFVFEPRTERHAALARELKSAGLTIRFLTAEALSADSKTLSVLCIEGAGILLADSEDALAQVEALRAAGSRTPIVVMRDVRNGPRVALLLDAGADDDIVIPVKGEELRARLRSIMRRVAGHAGRSLQFGEITVFFDGRHPEIRGEAIHLSGREYALFQHLALNARRITSKHALYDALYGLSEDRPYDKVIDVYLCKLRKKLSAASSCGHPYIETVHGRGYTLTTPDEPDVIAAE